MSTKRSCLRCRLLRSPQAIDFWKRSFNSTTTGFSWRMHGKGRVAELLHNYDDRDNRPVTHLGLQFCLDLRKALKNDSAYEEIVWGDATEIGQLVKKLRSAIGRKGGKITQRLVKDLKIVMGEEEFKAEVELAVESHNLGNMEAFKAFPSAIRLVGGLVLARAAKTEKSKTPAAVAKRANAARSKEGRKWRCPFCSNAFPLVGFIGHLNPNSTMYAPCEIAPVIGWVNLKKKKFINGAPNPVHKKKPDYFEVGGSEPSHWDAKETAEGQRRKSATAIEDTMASEKALAVQARASRNRRCATE